MATIRSYTTVEQSRKLVEILPLESADMDYIPVVNIDGEYSIAVNIWDNDHVIEEGWIPCWSLAALMKLLPSEFTTENEFGKYKYEIKIRKYKLTDNVDIYQIAYGNYKWHEDGSHSWKDMINTGQKEELLDVAFDMVCWLKENGNI